MAVASDLFKGSLEILGVYGAQETPSAADIATCLSFANRMLGSWSANELMIPSQAREEFTLVPSQQVYTMGSGGNFDTARPVRVVKASVIPVGMTEEIEIAVYTPEQWAGVSAKSLQSTIPRVVYTEGTFPLERVNLWPVPSAAVKVVLYSEKPLQTFAAATDTLLLAKHYEDAIVYNLAKRLQTPFGRPMSADDRQLADDSLAVIQRLNWKPALIVSDLYGMNGYGSRGNIFTGGRG